MALITDATMGLIRDQIGLQNEKLRNFAALYASSTWAQIQLDVKTLTRAALIAKYPIGTELVCKYTMDNVEYDCPWVVLDNDRNCTWQDGSVHQGLWLGMKYCTIEDIQFDAPEGVVITADDETVAEAGYYYCGVSGSTYTMLNLAAGDTIPSEKASSTTRTFTNTDITATETAHSDSGLTLRRVKATGGKRRTTAMLLRASLLQEPDSWRVWMRTSLRLLPRLKCRLLPIRLRTAAIPT